jgi:membrane protease YdiL (CAAX protease family)
VVQFFRSRALVLFFILAIGIALVAMAIRATDPGALGVALREIIANNQRADIITAFTYSLREPVLWNAILFPAAPTLAAFIVIAIAYGPHGLSRWFGRLAPWRGVSWRVGVSVWLLVALWFLAIVGVYLVYLSFTGGAPAITETIARFGSTPLWALGGFIIALLLSSGPLLEEMGWRGFALPMLLLRFNPLLASVILGTLWAAWHLPRDIAPLTSGEDGAVMAFLYKQIDVILGTIATSIIATFLYFKLGGSVWSGILAHAVNNEFVVNVARGDLPVWTIGEVTLRGWTLAECAIAILLVVLTGPSLGADEDQRQLQHPFKRPRPEE